MFLNASSLLFEWLATEREFIRIPYFPVTCLRCEAPVEILHLFEQKVREDLNVLLTKVEALRHLHQSSIICFCIHYDIQTQEAAAEEPSSKVWHKQN